MQPSPPESAPPAKGRRRWFLVLTASLVAIGIAYVQLRPEMERSARSWVTLALIVLGLVLGLIWFLFLGRFSRRARLITVGAIALAGVVLSQMVRVTGTISSIGFPRLAWKWTPQRGAQLTAVPPSVASVTSAPGIPDVPQFFGPNRDGIVTGATLRRDWRTAPPKQLWVPKNLNRHNG